MTQTDTTTETRAPLSRSRVLEAAIELADDRGLEALSMRNLADSLGVQAMSLYNHVANKDDILNGVLDVIIEEIEAELAEREAGISPADWKLRIRTRCLTARQVLLRHKWAPNLMTTRTSMSATVLRYFDAMLGTMIEGGFSIDLAHHAMHALGSNALGFTQEVFESDDLGPEVAAIFSENPPPQGYRHLVEMAQHVQHDAETTLGGGCDDQVEFEFALDLMLDGLERLFERT